MKKLFLLLTFHVSLLTFHVSAQQPTQEWVRIYNGPGNDLDFPTAIVVDSTGNACVVGTTLSSTQNNNFVTIKYNTSGLQEWIAIYNGPGTNSIDVANAVAEDMSGNYYVTGNSERSGFLTDDYCTIKYSLSGVQQWVSRYSGYNGTNYPYSISLDHSGNVYVTGTSTNNNGKQEIATVKYNNNGVQQWVNSYTSNPNMDCYVNSLAVDDSGNVFVGGSSSGYNNHNIILIKYSTSGVQQWVSISRGVLPIINKIKLDHYGNIYMTGRNYDTVLSKSYYITIKYNSSGIQQWLANYHGPSNHYNADDESKDIVIDNLGNVYVTGSSPDSTNFYYATIKYNSDGVQQWVQRYFGGYSYDGGKAIILDDQSNIYVTGGSVDNYGVNNFTTIKYNTNGVQQWLIQYPGGAIAIGLDAQKNVYVTGGNNAPQPQYADIVTIKCNQLDGIRKNSQKISVGYRLYQNYPNPFNPITNIKFQLRNSGIPEIRIYNAVGSLIEDLINAKLSAGEYEITWDGKNYSSGVYFYQLLVNNKLVDTKRMILIK